ncbi:MAG: hypothetical protein ABJC05_07440 [Pyrinomonadaceae bacterium]
MSRHLSEQDIERYRNRELLPDELLALDDHLGNCGSCQAEIRSSEKPNETSAQIMTALQAETDFDDTHLLYQEMADYVDNTLSEVDREIAEGHLECCQACKVEVDDLLATKASLTRLPGVTYSPREAPNLWRRLIALWQLPSIRIPAQALAAIILVALITWVLVSYSRKQAEEARLPAGQENKNVAGNSVVPAPRSGPTNTSSPQPDQSNAGLVVDLIDADHHIALNSEDKLLGLESTSPQIQSEVASALKNGRVKAPAFMVDLKGQSGRLMGTGSLTYGLLNPVATAVEPRTPTFRWRAIPGAENYVVTIYSSDGQKTIASDQLTETKWKASAPLERGRIYTWQVRANKKGQEVLLPPPAAAEAKFRIIDAATAKELVQVRHSDSRSHLVLGIAYAEAGMVDESEHELQKLLDANPKSPVARSLLRSVKSLRR